jgi:hypothetical protein
MVLVEYMNWQLQRETEVMALKPRFPLANKIIADYNTFQQVHKISWLGSEGKHIR